jgi:hypothetical protein
MIWLKHPEENGVMSMLGQPLNLIATYDQKAQCPVSDFFGIGGSDK